MRRDRKFWEKVVAIVENGTKQADAAEQFGVTRAAVQYWVSKLRRERDGRPAELLPVTVSGPAIRALELEVGGVVVRVPADAPVEYVADLVRALRAC